MAAAEGPEDGLCAGELGEKGGRVGCEVGVEDGFDFGAIGVIVDGGGFWAWSALEEDYVRDLGALEGEGEDGAADPASAAGNEDFHYSGERGEWSAGCWDRFERRREISVSNTH